MSTQTGAAAASPPPPTLPLVQALFVTIGVLVVVAGFIALGTWLHVKPLYAGFLLLWMWSALDKLSLKALPAALLGALVGTGLSFLLQSGTAAGSPALIALALGVTIFAVFLVVAGRAVLVCNQSTMLFVTVLNAPLLQLNEDLRAVPVALVLSAAYFGAVAWLIGRLTPK